MTFSYLRLQGDSIPKLPAARARARDGDRYSEIISEYSFARFRVNFPPDFVLCGNGARPADEIFASQLRNSAVSLEVSVYERAEREAEKDSERKREKERNRERARGRERERRIVRRNTCSHAKFHSSSRASSYCTGRGKETTTRIVRKGGEERARKKGARDTMPAMLVDSRISAECYAWNFL